MATITKDKYDPNDPSGWIKEPGYNCVAPPIANKEAKLEIGFSLAKTLPPNHISVLDGEIKLDRIEVNAINDDYLEVRIGADPTSELFVYTAIVTLIGVILFVGCIAFSVALMWVNESVWKLMSLLPLIGVFIGYALACGSFVNVTSLPTNNAIRFYRKTQKICSFKIPQPSNLPWKKNKRDNFELVSADWKNCRAQIARIYTSTGSTVSRLSYLSHAILDPVTGEVIDRIKWNYNQGGDLISTLQEWEIVRRYMQNPDAPIVPTTRQLNMPTTRQDCYDRANPFSFLFSNRAIFLNYRTRITKESSVLLKLVKVFDIPLAIIQWLLTPLVLYMTMWRWIIIKCPPKVDWSVIESSDSEQTAIKQTGAHALVEIESTASLQQAEIAKPTKRQKWLFRLWIGTYVFWFLSPIIFEVIRQVTLHNVTNQCVRQNSFDWSSIFTIWACFF